MLESFFNKYVDKFLNWDGRNGGCTDIVRSCAYQGWVCHANVTMVDGLSFLGGSSLEGTPHLEANKYLSKIRKSVSCIFSKYYMLTHKKQKNENFLLRRFFLMWAWSYTVKIDFLRGVKTKIIKYKMQKVVK